MSNRETALDKLSEAIQTGDHDTATVIFDYIRWMDSKQK